MKYLINYQKPDKDEVSTKKEIYFKNNGGGKLVRVFLLNK